jgi:prepilin-type N-terminal cleavage/methylation domain-containing protein
MSKFNQGITLLELLMSITIVGVLAAIAIPAFNNQIKNSKLKSAANQILTAYGIARSEAVSRNVQTRITGDSSGWNVSTVAFAGPPAVAAEVLNTFAPDSSGITWSPSTLPTITYNATGFRPFGSSEQVIQLCDDRSIGREITITTAGSVSVETLSSC